VKFLVIRILNRVWGFCLFLDNVSPHRKVIILLSTILISSLLYTTSLTMYLLREFTVLLQNFLGGLFLVIAAGFLAHGLASLFVLFLVTEIFYLTITTFCKEHTIKLRDTLLSFGFYLIFLQIGESSVFLLRLIEFVIPSFFILLRSEFDLIISPYLFIAIDLIIFFFWLCSLYKLSGKFDIRCASSAIFSLAILLYIHIYNVVIFTLD